MGLITEAELEKPVEKTYIINKDINKDYLESVNYNKTL